MDCHVLKRPDVLCALLAWLIRQVVGKVSRLEWPAVLRHLTDVILVRRIGRLGEPLYEVKHIFVHTPLLELYDGYKPILDRVVQPSWCSVTRVLRVKGFCDPQEMAESWLTSSAKVSVIQRERYIAAKHFLLLHHEFVLIVTRIVIHDALSIEKAAYYLRE